MRDIAIKIQRVLAAERAWTGVCVHPVCQRINHFACFGAEQSSPFQQAMKLIRRDRAARIFGVRQDQGIQIQAIRGIIQVFLVGGAG